jgi:hypothetical protein
MNSKEDERIAHCSVEEWEAGSIRVARVVVEIDAYLAGSYLTTNLSLGPRVIRITVADTLFGAG